MGTEIAVRATRILASCTMVIVVSACCLATAWAGRGPVSGESAGCVAAIETAERQTDVPAGVLAAIAMVESGRPDPKDGALRPWPWTINVKGTGQFFNTKVDAVAAVKVLRAQGIVSIDIGCMQVNLDYHPAAFSTIDEAFDPLDNVTYAAQYLSKLFRVEGSWENAVKAYHSHSANRAGRYYSEVLTVLHSGAVEMPAVTHMMSLFTTPEWTNGLKEFRNFHSVLTEQIITAGFGCSPNEEAVLSREVLTADRPWSMPSPCRNSLFSTPNSLRHGMLER